jgi:hypothetical protein
MLPQSLRSAEPASPAAQCRLFVAALATVVLIVSACSDRAVDSKTAAVPAPAASLPPPVSARYVKLEEVTELNGRPWASMAEFNLVDATGAALPRKDWIVSADSADASDAPRNAIDGDPRSHWHSRWDGEAPPPPHSFVVDLGASNKLSGFRYLPRQDKLSNGVIAQYRFYVSTDGVNWGKPVVEGNFADLGTPDAEKEVLFAKQSINHAPTVAALPAQANDLGQQVSLKVEANDEDGDPLRYSASGLPTGLGIAASSGIISGTPIVPGAYSASVTVKDNKGLATALNIAWSVAAPSSSPAAVSSSPGQGVRFVRLEQLTELNGGAWASMAEFNLIDAAGNNLPRTGWSARADSSDTSDAAANAIDGNPATLWHTHWDGDAPPPPHSFIVDLGAPMKIAGFRYLPRQDKPRNGTIAKYRFYVSADGLNWGQPVAEGDFTALGSPLAEKTVHLK